MPWTGPRSARLKLQRCTSASSVARAETTLSRRTPWSRAHVQKLNSPDETAASRAAYLVRANWQLTQLRKTIDDAFDGLDLVALPTNRVGPRTIKEQLEREEKPTSLEPEALFNSLAFDL